MHRQFPKTFFFPTCTDVREVFDLFDFWDGRDGLVDGAKLGDFLRCCGLNPTTAQVIAHGGTQKFGKSFLFQSFVLSCRQSLKLSCNLYNRKMNFAERRSKRSL